MYQTFLLLHYSMYSFNKLIKKYISVLAFTYEAK